MKKIYFLLILFFVLISNTFSQTVFPLEVGTKWYYQGYHYVYVDDITQRKDSYFYGIIKGVTGIVNDSTKEITAKYIYKDSLITKKEFWAFKDGKFYASDDPLTMYSHYIYDERLERDSCNVIYLDITCVGIINYQIFNFSGYAQSYSRSRFGRYTLNYFYTVTLPQVGIVVKGNKQSSVYTNTTVDSAYLIGMYTSGLFLGDTTFNITVDTVFPITKYGYSLSQNYPNPFNPTTKIKYQVPHTGFVTLKIYDLLGREIATLINEEKPAGSYEVEFDGSGLTSGIYFYKLQAENYTGVKKMVLMK